jgi:hypothetical protein
MRALLLAGGCGGDAPSASSATATSFGENSSSSLTPEQLGELGAQIRREPARADELLAKHKLTRESFERAIRDVTENPEASRRYAAAYKTAS